jgi:tetratricopeptide (TPR) repeat protein
LLGRKLVVEPSTTCNPLDSFANESTSGEWSEEGNRLLNHREFEEAIMAFDNAGDIYMAAVATAYQSREVARNIHESQTRHRREAFVNAANSFEQCAELAKTAEEEWTHYAAAARCYAEIKYHQDVVRAFKLANMFTEAASYCFHNNLLDNAVSIIKKHEAEVDPQTTDCIKEVARLSYLESKDLE